MEKFARWFPQLTFICVIKVWCVEMILNDSLTEYPRFLRAPVRLNAWKAAQIIQQETQIHTSNPWRLIWCAGMCSGSACMDVFSPPSPHWASSERAEHSRVPVRVSCITWARAPPPQVSARSGDATEARQLRCFHPHTCMCTFGSSHKEMLDGNAEMCKPFAHKWVR